MRIVTATGAWQTANATNKFHFSILTKKRKNYRNYVSNGAQSSSVWLLPLARIVLAFRKYMHSIVTYASTMHTLFLDLHKKPIGW